MAFVNPVNTSYAKGLGNPLSKKALFLRSGGAF